MTSRNGNSGSAEKKVTWAAVGAFVAPLALAIVYSVLDALLKHPEIFDALPTWVKVIAMAAVAGATGFFAGYRATHTWRDDPEALKQRPE